MGRQTLDSEIAAVMNAARKTNGAGTGRPRSKSRRCPCRQDTLRRALSRAAADGTCPPADGHEPSCRFYRECIIVDGFTQRD